MADKIEHINATDTLNEGRVKLNRAIDDSNIARDKAESADIKSDEALANSESTQTQLDTIVIEGDSSVEAAQARVDSVGKEYSTLKERLDEENQEVTQQLADTDDYLSKSGITNRRTPYPMITWIDDDGKKGLFTKLYPIFESRGIPLTAAIIPNRVGNNGYISETEIKEMMEKGLEIVSHTNEHDPNDRPIDLPKERLREGYRSAKKKIIEWGGNHRGVVYPFGNYNKTIY